MLHFRICAIFVAVTITACAPTLPNGAIPVDLLKARETLVAETPGTVAFEIDSKSHGFLIGENGNAVFISKTSSSGLTTETQVASFDADEICLSPSGSWSGICISIFQSPTDGYVCAGKFGNGSSWTSTCTVQALTSSDRR